MNSAGLLFLALFLIYYLGTCFGLGLLFKKADEDSWKAYIPGLNFAIWAKLIGKPWYWAVAMFVPILGVIVWVTMLVELAKAYGLYKLGQHALAVLFPFAYLPKVGLDKEVQYVGPPISFETAVKRYQKSHPEEKLILPGKKTEKAKADRQLQKVWDTLSTEHKNVLSPFRSAGREWGDAILFAATAALIIRAFFIEAFIIPTTSMERTLLAGDFLFVSKYHYGTRMPMAPLSLPFIHNKIFGIKTYTDLVTLPYYRLPGLTEIKRNDIVVFNYPAHDINDLGDGAGTVNVISMKENYVKRCVAIPGDLLEIKNGDLYINEERAWDPPKLQLDYVVEVKNGNIGYSGKEMREMGFRADGGESGFATFSSSADPNNMNWHVAGPHNSVFLLNADVETAETFGKGSHIDTMYKYNFRQDERMPGGVRNTNISPAPFYNRKDVYKIYPNNFSQFPWNIDHYGPIRIPYKGMEIDLSDPKQVIMYKRVIEGYEGHDFSVRNNDVLIDGQVAKTYTVEDDYYFMMGDNRHGSEDSRFWGFVPMTHVVGRPLFIFMSYESTFGPRFNRIGTSKIVEQYR
ncbi:MAG: signal peptidase I [Bacteroidia bacterium]